jgi:hypothetical protein
LKSDADLVELLNNLFARKSTNTLHKRADALFRFISYCWNTSREPLPISLSAVYAYVNSLKAQKPSAAQGFREALNFASGLLGLDNADVCAQDPLIQGAAFSQLLKKRIRVQARIPTVKGLSLFLEFICNSGSVIDVVFLGFCCLCITLRSRWNDAQYSDELIEDFNESDGGYLQLNTVRHKTANSVQKRTTFLEMTGPVEILGSRAWYDRWQACRAICGLGLHSKPMMPVINKEGLFGKVPMPASPASVYYREILHKLGLETEHASTHCFKALYLSWAAKFNVDYDSRAVLGYHALPFRASTYCYSRDNLAGPLLELQKVLDAVVEGKFEPDSTRSGRFVEKRKGRRAEEDETGEQVEILNKPADFVLPTPKRVPSAPAPLTVCKSDPDEVVISSEDETTQSDTDESSVASNTEAGECAELWNRSEARTARAPASSGDVQKFYYHLSRHTVHAFDEDKGELACGRRLNPQFHLLIDEPSSLFPKCKVCFGLGTDSDV